MTKEWYELIKKEQRLSESELDSQRAEAKAEQLAEEYRQHSLKTNYLFDEIRALFYGSDECRTFREISHAVHEEDIRNEVTK